MSGSDASSVSSNCVFCLLVCLVIFPLIDRHEQGTAVHRPLVMLWGEGQGEAFHSPVIKPECLSEL